MSWKGTDDICVDCDALEGIAALQAKGLVPQVGEDGVLLYIRLVRHDRQGQLDNQGEQGVLEGSGMSVREYLKTEVNDMVSRIPFAAGTAARQAADWQGQPDNQSEQGVPEGYGMIVREYLNTDVKDMVLRIPSMVGVAALQAEDSVAQVDEDRVLVFVGLVGHNWQGRLGNEGEKGVIEGSGTSVSEFLETNVNGMVVRVPSAAVVTPPVPGHNVAVEGENREDMAKGRGSGMEELQDTVSLMQRKRGRSPTPRRRRWQREIRNQERTAASAQLDC